MPGSIAERTDVRLVEVEVAKLDLRPHDRLLVRPRQKLSPEQRKALAEAIKDWAGCEISVLVLHQDIELQIGSVDRPIVELHL